MSKIRVMLVEDSAVIRELLTYIIGRDPRLEVAACVESGEEALSQLHRVAPDVISMDIRLPGMNGLEATKRIMSLRPTPIVVIAGSVASAELNIGIEALRAGALTVLEKPVGVANADYELFAERICTQLVIMSQVRVVRQRQEPRAQAVSVRVNSVADSPVIRLTNSGRYSILGIVASTGGPNAVVQVLNGLKANFPLPILLVQHITPSFQESFVTWLNGVCPFKAVIARHNEIPEAGKVYVASADRHLRVEGGCLKLDNSEPVSFQRPSGTVLFASMASLQSRALGVLLTGMGDDGARGLLAIREAGGFTIAEDESTSVVYGMPAEAVRLKAVCESLPLQLIAPPYSGTCLKRLKWQA